jgi:hypothetical protein
VPHNEPPRRSQRTRRSAISDDYEVNVSEEIQMEGDPFNPSIGKLDPKTVSCHFIGNLDKSKGFHFYCPDR